MSAPHSSQIRLFSTDLDGTLVGDTLALARFQARWDALPAQRRPLLVYNTGRRLADVRQLVALRRLPEPDFIIGSVGTELHDSLYDRGADFRAQFRDDWELARVEQIVATLPGARRQSPELSHAFKSSWTWPRARRDDVDALRRRFAAAGLQVTVVYSCQHFLDLLPARADKGKSLGWLCQRLGIALTDVLVAGDSANDSSMFLLPNVRGVVVANALPELCADIETSRVFHASAALADGVIEGLVHFGVLHAGVDCAA